MKVCKFEGCAADAKGGHGYCCAHYKRWRRGTLYPKPPTPCEIDGCEKNSRPGYDWCHSHAARYFMFGDPLGSAHGDTCEIEGCDNRHYRTGLCAAHHRRRVLYGDPNEGGKVLQPSHTEHRLPVQPFLDYVEEHGGLIRFLDGAGFTKDRRNTMQKAIDRAKAAGTWTVVTADRTVIRLCGVHPFEVYGDAWWTDDLDEDEPEQVAA